MSDKLKELTPINITFEDGESPTGNKLESSFDQVANAMNVIERAIGDTWNQNSETGGPLDSDPNHIANISRAIGSMSSVNPGSLGGNELSVTGEAVPEGKKIFALNNAPDDPTNPSAITFSNPTGVFDTLVATLALVDSTGDYFIESNGLVHTYSLTGATHTVDYDYTTITDSYSGATYNVMPDPAQATRCTVIVSGDGRQITLPTVTDGASKNYGQQLLIPGELDSLLDAEEIPAGYMYVWDHVGGGGQRANSIVEGLTFKKIGAPGSSLATFYVEGVDLAVSASEPNRYSVVCAGTRVSKTLEYLRDYLMSHRHNDNLSAFLSHTDLLGSDAAVAHGVISSIVGVDDVQILQNKTLVEALIYDAAGPDIMIKAVSDEIVFKDPTDSTFKELGLSSIPDALTGKQAQYVTDANDGTSGIPANSTATADNLLPLNGSGLFPASVIDDGHDNGLDADTLDGQHAPAGTIVGDTDTQTMTNKRLTLPKINSANTTGITSEELETLSGGGDAAGLHTHTADIATPAAYEYADTLASWTSAGTFGWTVPAGVSRMFIAIWGGGGGGGDGGFSKGSGGGGGGGGGFSGLDLIVTPGHSVSVTVGVAGAGGSGTVGSAGGNSSVTINSVQVAYAGGGGAGQLGWTGGAGAGYASFDGSNVYAQEFSGLTFVGSEFFYDNSSKATQLSKGGNGDGGYLYGAAGGSGGWGGNGGNGDGWVYWGNGYHGAAGAAGTNTRFISIMSPNLGGVGGGSGGAPGAGGKGGGRGYNGVAGGAGRVRIYYHA